MPTVHEVPQDPTFVDSSTDVEVPTDNPGQYQSTPTVDTVQAFVELELIPEPVIVEAASAEIIEGLTMGVAIGTGISPTVRVDAGVGSVTGTGVDATAKAAADQGIAVGTGISPPTVVVTFSPGVATGVGIAPGEIIASGPPVETVSAEVPLEPVPEPELFFQAPTAIFDSLTPGVAIGTGISPTATATSGVGQAVGTSTLPTARTSVTIATATGAGVSPTARTSTALAVGIGSGISPPAVVVTFSPGLALGIGISPTAPPGEFTALPPLRSTQRGSVRGKTAGRVLVSAAGNVGSSESGTIIAETSGRIGSDNE